MCEIEKTPFVSIVCNTYNHVNFIRQCLDGFIMQQTSFPFEILVHDDASTDGTADIVREYERNYPDIIKPIYQKENQYSKGVKVSLTYQYSRAKGKYIALCEGDDYWTDPMKLQKQVDFLECHEGYVMCSHRFKQLDQQTGAIRDDWYGRLSTDVLYTLETIVSFEEWYTQPLSILFLKDALDLSLYEKYQYSRDLVLVYTILKKGGGVMFNSSMGVYRQHQGGIWTGIPYAKQILSDLKACISIYNVDKSVYAAKMLYNRLNYCGRLGGRFIFSNFLVLLNIYRIIYLKCGFDVLIAILTKNILGLSLNTD